MKELNFKLKKKHIITYEIKKLEPSKKVLFVYLLKGRNSRGVIKELRGEFLANGCFIIPDENLKEIRDILNKWNVKYKEKEVYLMD